MMFYYQINDDCTVVSLSLDNPPKPAKDGSLTFDGGDLLRVQARTHHEAVDDDGRVLGAGKYFKVCADKGMKLTFRPITSGKTFTEAQIKRARRATTETVVCQDYGGGPFVFDGALKDVIASLGNILDGIPEQYRGKAKCRIDSKSGYEDSHYATIEVSYSRPETDAEVVARLEDEAVADMLSERAERDQFERLKGKFQ